jgi:NADPH:quinone reductase-like Zn-dependent oxidoreductase
MKAIRLRARGGPESLHFEDAPTPWPRSRRPAVRIKAPGCLD